jgi:hypothetical protein
VTFSKVVFSDVLPSVPLPVAHDGAAAALLAMPIVINFALSRARVPA